MILTILQNTPYWVWALLILLLVLGLGQTRTRTVARSFVLLLPAAMIALSLYGVIASFGASFASFGAWAIGLVVAAVLNGLVFLGPRGVRCSADGRRVKLPGSWVPLLLMLTIFSTRFVLGVTWALNPAMVTTASVVVCASSVLGICSGLFLSRAVRSLTVQREVAA